MLSHNELFHHGIIGQKWGVRRYQNYDGSYTKAGLKRFNDSLDKYEKANTRYSGAKRSYKANKTGDNKIELTNSWLQRNGTKRRLEKDYKHLKQDKLADKGKELYSKGNRIQNNTKINGLMATAGLTSFAIAANGYYKGSIKSAKVINWLAGTGIGLVAVSQIKQLKNYNDARKLRAYYGHTSNY